MGELLWQLAVSLVLTELLELLFALACRVRGKHTLCTVILVNVLTNPPVVFLSVVADALGVPRAGALFLLEAAAVLTEGAVYRRARLMEHPYLFSLGANAFSCTLGVLASYFMLLCGS